MHGKAKGLCASNKVWNFDSLVCTYRGILHIFLKDYHIQNKRNIILTEVVHKRSLLFHPVNKGHMSV